MSSPENSLDVQPDTGSSIHNKNFFRQNEWFFNKMGKLANTNS